jgi:hypothetical protein
MFEHRVVGLCTAVAVVAALSACGSGGGAASGNRTSTTAQTTAVIDPGDGGHYRPEIDPADFVERIDNPYMPLPPGARWVYEGESDGEAERTVVEVTGDTREVMGITATVVRDTVYVDGELAEDTYDWFAQDREGNVWYLGEDTHEYEGGQAVSSAGAWEAGVDGAEPGIVMPAHPKVSQAYRQEFLRGEAEDMGQIVEVAVTRSIDLGTFADVVVTRDWTPLEPDVVEEKWYAAGVGLIREADMAGSPGSAELVEHTTGP